jgi:hypothetical protein
MIRITLITTMLIALISCTPEDKTRVELENKLGGLSLKLGSSSVAIDYEIVSYSVVDSITTRKQNENKLGYIKEDLRVAEYEYTRELKAMEKYGSSYGDPASLWLENIEFHKKKLKDLEATLTDEVIAIEYTVVIAYYNPILKVDVTQKKLVTLTDINKLK